MRCCMQVTTSPTSARSRPSTGSPSRGLRTVKVAVHGRETPAALTDAADVVVDGPAGLVTLLRGL